MFPATTGTYPRLKTCRHWHPVIQMPQCLWSVHVKSTLRDAIMPDIPSNVAGIDARMAILTESLRELVEQVAVFSGAAHEQLILQRIVAQDAKHSLN